MGVFSRDYSICPPHLVCLWIQSLSQMNHLGSLNVPKAWANMWTPTRLKVQLCTLLVSCKSLQHHSQTYSIKLCCVDMLQCCFLLIHIAKPPKISTHPSSQENILPGNSVAFTIQATGTEPLTYQWQRSPPAGDEGGSKEWQNLICDKVGLKVTGVQANTGYYRCLVSNSAGSDTSECALLTVGKLQISLY